MQCGVEEERGRLWEACVGVRQQLPPLHTLTDMCAHPRALLVDTQQNMFFNCNTKVNCFPPQSCRVERLLPPLQLPPLPCMWSKCSPWGAPQPTASGEDPRSADSPYPPYFSVDPLSMTQQAAVPYQRALGPRSTAPTVPYSSSRGY